jgi:hypothetical protein
MNSIASANQTTVPVGDPKWVAEIAMRQLRLVTADPNRSIVDLFLKDPFVLGYAIGFVEQACWLSNDGDGEKNNPDFLRTALAHMLSDPVVATSFLSFAIAKQGTRVFEGGYDAGLQDLDALFLSHGAQIPCSLAYYLRSQSIQV